MNSHPAAQRAPAHHAPTGIVAAMRQRGCEKQERQPPPGHLQGSAKLRMDDSISRAVSAAMRALSAAQIALVISSKSTRVSSSFVKYVIVFHNGSITRPPSLHFEQLKPRLANFALLTDQVLLELRG